MSNKFEQLSPDDVISGFANFLKLPRTFKANELVEVVKTYFNEKSSAKLFDNGLEMEVLRLDGKGWRKGRVRFSLEFCSDEPSVMEELRNDRLEIVHPKSTLDDIRKMMNENG